MKRFLAFLLSLVVFLFVFSIGLPALYGVDYPRSSVITRNPDLDPEMSARFEEIRPEMVLLGNSMLGEGIDESILNALIPDRVLKLGLDGAASAVWYLVIKNFICAQDPPPQVTVLFFRDTFLTWPRYRVDGRYKGKVDKYAGPDEYFFDSRAYLDGMSRYSYFMNSKFALWGERENLRDDLVGFAKFGVPAAMAGADSTLVDDAIARTFADSNMNTDLLTVAQLAAEDSGDKIDHQDFHAALELSFLPSMLDLLEEQGIETIMVRIKRRGDLEPNSRSAALEEYIRQLSAYFASRNVGFLDYSGDENLLEEHFGEGDHLNEQGREIFTRMFAEDLKALRAGEDRR